MRRLFSPRIPTRPNVRMRTQSVGAAAKTLTRGWDDSAPIPSVLVQPVLARVESVLIVLLDSIDVGFGGGWVEDT